MDERCRSDEQVHFRGRLPHIQKTGLNLAKSMGNIRRYVKNDNILLQILYARSRLRGAFFRRAHV